MGRRGKFITFEGVEGSGKTTQASLLCDYLRRNDVSVAETREPGGTRVGENIREILLSPADAAPMPTAELLLFLAARAQLVAEVISPALAEGKWVICDRFSDATLAYQGYGRGIDVEVVRTLDDVATGGLRPDMTILLDLEVDAGIGRAIAGKKEFSGGTRGDRMERENREFHQRVRDGYLALAEQERERFKVIHVTGSIEAVHRTVASLVEPFLIKVA